MSLVFTTVSWAVETVRTTVLPTTFGCRLLAADDIDVHGAVDPLSRGALGSAVNENGALRRVVSDNVRTLPEREMCRHIQRVPRMTCAPFEEEVNPVESE